VLHMQLLPMDVPAELHRWLEAEGAAGANPCEMRVASGPLIIMAYGLMSIDPAERDRFWITSELGDLTASEAEEALRRWSAVH
jgi:hypothetical protein